jgi:hypothetical protein
MASHIFSKDGTIRIKFKGQAHQKPNIPDGRGGQAAAADRYSYNDLPPELLTNNLFIEDPARPDEPDWPRTQPAANRNKPVRGEWQYPMPCIDPFTFHHIIPWNTLRETWSCLAFEQNWDMLKTLMGAFGITGANSKVQQMKNSELNDTAAAEIHEHLCWVKWNVVEGPLNTHRIDDAENDFDDFQYGLTAAVKTQMADVKNLFQAMDGFITISRRFKADTFKARRDKKPIRPSSTGILRDMLNTMLPYLMRSHIPFKWEMWHPVTNGGKVGTWAWNPQPTWKRASKDRSAQVLHDEIARFGNSFDPAHVHGWWG